MAYIMPLCLVIFLLLVTATFYFHDKCVLYATAYETAVAAAQMERQEGGYPEAELAAHFEERAGQKLIFFSSAAAVIKEQGEYLLVEAEAEKGGWTIHAQQRAMRMEAEQLIYYSGRIGDMRRQK